MATESSIILTAGNPSSDTKGCVIWLHGLGANGNDFAPIVPALTLPDDMWVEFVFPHAPEIPVTVNGGMKMRAWYDITRIDNLDRDIDSIGLQQSCASITALATEKARQVGWDALVIAGFSQGGAVAAHLLEYLPDRCAGIVCLSTYAMHTIAPKINLNKMPALVMHGDADQVVPPQLGRSLADNLQQAGLAVRSVNYPMGHEVCPSQISEISKWLVGVFKKSDHLHPRPD